LVLSGYGLHLLFGIERVLFTDEQMRLFVRETWRSYSF
jgi:hypothetical protein